MAFTGLAAIADATKNLAHDLISSVHFPRVKISFGGENTATDVSAANPFPVTLGLTDAQLRATAVAVSFTGQSVGITGSVGVTGTFWQATQPISAAALPLPTGAATSAAQTTGNASLASIDGKTPALVGGLVPVSVPTNATTTRAYALANAIRVGFTATSTTEAALPTLGATREIRFAASARCWVKWGATGLTAAAAENVSFVLEANAPEVLTIPAGATHFRVIRDTADGNVLMTPVA